jgi:hypothetical protein
MRQNYVLNPIGKKKVTKVREVAFSQVISKFWTLVILLVRNWRT